MLKSKTKMSYRGPVTQAVKEFIKTRAKNEEIYQMPCKKYQAGSQRQGCVAGKVFSKVPWF